MLRFELPGHAIERLDALGNDPFYVEAWRNLSKRGLIAVGFFLGFFPLSEVLMLLIGNSASLAVMFYAFA